MLQNINQLYGKKLGATDGEIGHVKDFYFDDKTWAIRYLVVDTGSWLIGRQVLLSPEAFGPQALEQSNEEPDVIQVHLTRKRIEESPSIESQLPVTRRDEDDHYRYYGWPNYWSDGAVWGGAGLPVVVSPPVERSALRYGYDQREDRHLQSTVAITGYQIEASDGQLGSVSSFVVDSKTWSIRELAIETGHWYAGKTILILPENVTRISAKHSSVFVNLSKETLKQTTRNDVAQAELVEP